ncbi:MAG TPA: TonB family protein [Chthoniobacterales bacterium]|nr:TonB family protein [Chthoniobacterales bacterium]
MPTTEIPTRTTVSSSPPDTQVRMGDLYDAEGWESAYRTLHDVPELLVQLQDELSRSRWQEAFWISVVFHLTVLIFLVNLQNIANRWWRAPVIAVSPNDLMRQKELTFLELPPDEQKLTKPPESDRISDKNRIATSRAPQLDRRELKKILDSARPGAPGQPVPQAPQQPAAQPSPAQSAQGQQPSQSSGAGAPPPPQNQNQVANLDVPRVRSAKPSFETKPLSPGSAIEQAGRAAIANRGSYGGDNGDFGLNQGSKARAQGQVDVLSDTMGVDFGPYLTRILREIKANWVRQLPESALSGLKRGKLAIEFYILRDGRTTGMALTDSSGDVALDRSAWGGITASDPFPALPNEFAGQYLKLRIRFYCNMEEAELR